jgi:hypothetical protein
MGSIVASDFSNPRPTSCERLAILALAAFLGLKSLRLERKGPLCLMRYAWRLVAPRSLGYHYSSVDSCITPSTSGASAPAYDSQQPSAP